MLLSLLALLGGPATALASSEFLVTDGWTNSVGVVAGQDRWHLNLCARLGIEPGQHRSVRVSVENGLLGWNVAAPPNKSNTSKIVAGTLVCGPMLDVWGHTTGPGANGISMPCPPREEPIGGGAGVYYTPHGHLTQVHGGFGHNDDGYWHYKFHNWSGETVYVQLWGVCWRGRP